MMTPKQKELIRNLKTAHMEPWLGNADWVGFAEMYGATPDTWRHRYRRIKKSHKQEFHTLIGATDVEQKETPVSTNTPFEQMVINAGLDPSLYYLEEGKVWGHPANPHMSVKLQIKPEVVDWDSVAQKLQQPPYVPEGRSLGDWIAVFNLYDVHLFKQAIDAYDNGDKQRRLVKGIAHLLLQRLAPYKNNIARLLFPLGNDFLNFDNITMSTSAGTPQANIGPWKAGIDCAVELAIDLVRMVSKYYPTTVIMVEGNHDRFSNHLLGHVLKHAFGLVKHVDVQSSATGRHYYKHYECGLMFAHGDKKLDWQTLWATESPTSFISSFKEVHIGHTHTLEVKEVGGVLVRRNGSLSPTGQWDSDNGYVGSRRQGTAVVYNRYGRVADLYADSAELD